MATVSIEDTQFDLLLGIYKIVNSLRQNLLHFFVALAEFLYRIFRKALCNALIFLLDSSAIRNAVLANSPTLVPIPVLMLKTLVVKLFISIFASLIKAFTTSTTQIKSLTGFMDLICKSPTPGIWDRIVLITLYLDIPGPYTLESLTTTPFGF